MAAKRRATSPPLKRDLDALSEEEQKEELGKYIKSWSEDFLKWLLNEIQEELKSRETKSELGAQMEGIHLRENSEEVENLKPEKEEKPLCVSQSGEMEITDKAEDTHIEDVEGREEKEKETGMKVQELQELEEGKAEQDQCIKEDLQHSCGEEAMEEDQIEKLQHVVNQKKEMDASMNAIEEGKILEKEVVQQAQVAEEKEMSTSIEEATQENEEALNDGGEAQQEEMRMLPATLEVQEEEEPRNVEEKMELVLSKSFSEAEVMQWKKQNEEKVKQEAEQERREKARQEKDKKNEVRRTRSKNIDEIKKRILLKGVHYRLLNPTYPKLNQCSKPNTGKAWVCDMSSGIAHHITFNEDGIVSPGQAPNGFFPKGYAKLVNACFRDDVNRAEGVAYFLEISDEGEGAVVNLNDWEMKVNNASFNKFYSQLKKSDPHAFLVYTGVGVTEKVLGFFRSNGVLIQDLLEQDIFLVDVSEAKKVKKGLEEVSDASLLERVKALRDIIRKETSNNFNCLDHIVDVLQYYKVKEDY